MNINKQDLGKAPVLLKLKNPQPIVLHLQHLEERRLPREVREVGEGSPRRLQGPVSIDLRAPRVAAGAGQQVLAGLGVGSGAGCPWWHRSTLN